MSETPHRPCEWSWLGRVGYTDGLELQEQRAEQRKQDRGADALFLLEHPPVITLGRGARSENVLLDRAALDARGVQLFETGRGGDATYHGPGQVVGYPVIALAPDRKDVRRYVRDLEEVLIRTAAEYGVTAGRVDGLTGVWVGHDKLAAIGVRISRWVTSHGVALNVTTDLSSFDLIVPCGIRDRGVTSLARLTGRDLRLDEVARRMARHFGDVFDRRMVRSGEAPT